MATPKKGFKVIFGPEFNRLQKSLGQSIKIIDELMIQAGGNLSKKWVAKLKKNAPAFSTFLMDSIELRKGAKKSVAGGRGIGNLWLITISAPYAKAQETGARRHWVGRNFISAGGYRFGDWMDAKGFSGPGMYVGGPNSRMGKENAFMSQTEEEMVPVAEKEVAKLFARTSKTLRRK